MDEARLSSRKLRIWRDDYLSYIYLWRNIEWAVQQARSLVPIAHPIVLDVGCGNKPYADLFTGCKYQGLDCTTVNSSPDIIGSAMDIPLRDEAIDIVFSTQVIEHVPDPSAMVNECCRVLRPGGILVLTGPFYWPLHEAPYDFHRFTKYGFANLLGNAGFSAWEIKADGGDWAQIFLSINLRMRGKLLLPVRILFNLVGRCLDRVDHRELSPSNYTIVAIK
jgi:SAM-dependent methyltransferase